MSQETCLFRYPNPNLQQSKSIGIRTVEKIFCFYGSFSVFICLSAVRFCLLRQM